MAARTMRPKRRRLALLVSALALLGGAAALALTALDDTMRFFHSPSEVAAGTVHPGREFRLGGLVEAGSLTRSGTSVSFRVVDGAHGVTVHYTGLLPDLFREGQGVVAMGALDSGRTFRATQILAKHDETYMPPEAAEALRRAQKADGS